MKIFPLRNSKLLAEKIERCSTHKIGKIESKVFANGEIKVEFLESIRGKKVFILGSLNTHDDIIEMLMAADAAKRASAKEIIAVTPNLAYMRQDRKDTPRTAIGARVIANMLEASGINQVVMMDLHANQIEGFFNIPTTHLTSSSFFIPFIEENFDTKDLVIVSPDFGAAKKAKKFSNILNCGIAIINKEREVANEVASVELLGNVKGKNVIIVDDMVDTAGSLVKAVDLLKENGAKKVYACITHGVLSGPARDRIHDSKLEKLFISDTIENTVIEYSGVTIKIVSCANIISQTIHRIKSKESVNELIPSV
jgi:ribose-phosphate pyrophosphokinase